MAGFAHIVEGLRSVVPTGALTRFAPSPTGYLHMGHVASALCVWGLARALGAKVLLRIEDHDVGRCRKEYEQAIIEDLAWLGFIADIAPELGRASTYRQSDNDFIYSQNLEHLIKAGLVYSCACTRREILARTGDVAQDELRYDGFCRDRALAMTPGTSLRLRFDQRRESFIDAFLGPQVQTPAAQCGDLLLRDRHGQWTYQFAVVVDDLRHGIDLVIRGQDLLASTGRQLTLARLLGGGKPPVYLHHPVLLGADGLKLSKRQLAAGIGERRRSGERPEHLLGEAAWHLGLIETPAPVAARDLGALFT